MRILLNEHASYPWTKFDGAFFRGYFIVNGLLYRKEEAISYMLTNLREMSFQELLTGLNGVFAIIIFHEEVVLFATDRVRSFPLYYSVNGNDLLISDNIWSLCEILPSVTFCEVSMEDYNKNELFVIGEHTLFEQIKQLPGSEWAKFTVESGSVEHLPYFQHIHGRRYHETAAMKQDFEEAYKSVSDNLMSALAGRTAVIPLSGGADSRMIATLLRDAGYDNVICFTYGRQGNKEMKISELVAMELGFPWIYVPYSRKSLRSLASDSDFQRYLCFAGGGTSTPHIQDFLAVKHLVYEKIIPPDAVFIPGHSGDLLAGSQITEEELSLSLVGWESLLSIVKRRFYNNRFLSGALLERIRLTYEKKFCETSDPSSAIEWFNIMERQAKFIVNSVRVYEFFGYEWLIPLWDSALFEFWSGVPALLRYQRKIYFECINDAVPSTNDPHVFNTFRRIVNESSALTSTIRHVTKPIKYFSSPLLLENLYTFPEYMLGYLSNDEYFTVNSLVKETYLSLLKEKYVAYYKQ